MAARQGPMAMAAHQICMQVWLAVSLLTDSLAASAQVMTNSLMKTTFETIAELDCKIDRKVLPNLVQALIAGALSKNDYKTVKDVTNFVLKVRFFP